jgi:hypothetical protein
MISDLVVGDDELNRALPDSWRSSSREKEAEGFEFDS